MGEDSNGAGPVVRTFDTGANRDVDTGKLDYEGFLSPLVLERYAQYMHKNRHLRDGSLRDSDNWQKGIPLPVYMKSGWRHFMEWWSLHRRVTGREEMVEALCALMFNVMGYLHELLKIRNETRVVRGPGQHVDPWDFRPDCDCQYCAAVKRQRATEKK